MATGGQKPKTKAQKKASGTYRPGSDPERVGTVVAVDFPLLPEAPDPPEWFSTTEASDLWDQIAGLLFGQRVMTTVDVHALAHLCQLHGEIVDGYKRRIPPTAAQLAQLRIYFSEFGMTPASRARVTKADPKEGANKFSGNGRSRKS